MSDDSDEDKDDLGIGNISDDQKYKIFLKPSSKNQDNENATDDSWPEIQDDTDSLNLDDEMNQDISEFTGLEELDELPDYSSDDNNKDATNQSKTETKSKKRVLLWILWGLIIIAIILAGWRLIESKSEKKLLTQQEEIFDNTTKLAIMEPLKGRYVKGRADKIKIFVLEGEIANSYPAEASINSIEVEGMLYDQKKSIIKTSTAYARGKLTTTQLERWPKDKIESYMSSDKEIQSEDTLQFQIVFFDVPKNIHGLGAKINRFTKSKN